MSIVSKVKNVLASPDRGVRILSVLNKSPIRHVIKATLGMRVRSEVDRRKIVAADLSLSAEELAGLAVLNEQGFVSVNQFLDAEVVSALYQDALKKFEMAQTQANTSKRKDFWFRILDSEVRSEKWTQDNPYVRFTLNPSILKIVSKYFGEVPYVNTHAISWSRPDSGPLRDSQLWHLDRDDVKVVKVFIYLSDVNDDRNGPFTVLSKKASLKVRNSFIPKHLTDEDVFKTVEKSDAVAMTGPKLTAFICDTNNCYHMGSRVKQGGARLLYFAAYTSVPPIYPRFDNLIRITRPVSEFEELVLKTDLVLGSHSARAVMQ